MADVAQQLVAGTYTAIKRPTFSTEVVRTDGGREQRNGRWTQKLAAWDVTIPWCKRNSAAFVAVEALFEATLGSLRTFTFHDPVACADVLVRFVDDELTITPDGNLVQVSFSIAEQRA